MTRAHMSCGGRTAGVIAFVAIASGCGCGRTTPLVPVAGRVVFVDHSPVVAGTIEFRPRDGGPPARSAIDSDGRFILATAGRQSAVAGMHDVLVLQFVVVEGVDRHLHRGSLAQTPYRRVHERHGQAGRSGLTATVTSNEPRDVVITVEQQPTAR